MKRDAKRIGSTDAEVQVSAAGQIPGTDATNVGPTSQKGDPDADWLSMATEDPALYIKETDE
jgi:hypothetical protein